MDADRWTVAIASWRRNEEENLQMLGLADGSDPPGHVLTIQRTLEPGEQDRSLGMDTYCLVDGLGRTHFGGIADAVAGDGRVLLRLDEAAATVFECDAFALALAEGVPERLVRYALATLLREDDGPDLTGGHAEALIGSHLLVGLTYLAPDGTVVDRLQFEGRVEDAGAEVVGVRRSDTGELFTLPPAAEAYEPAPEGEYRLRESGRVVVDPDFLCTMTVHLAEQGTAPGS